MNPLMICSSHTIPERDGGAPAIGVRYRICNIYKYDTVSNKY